MASLQFWYDIPHDLSGDSSALDSPLADSRMFVKRSADLSENHGI